MKPDLSLLLGYPATGDAPPPAPAPGVSSIAPSSGFAVGGTSITITGTDFVATPTVAIGGAACTSVVFVNATTITCATGAHAAGAADVVVTNPDAQTGTLVGGFTFVAAPTVTSVAPTSGFAVGGTALTLTGTGYAGSPTVTIGGSAATSVVRVNSTTITCNAPAHAAGLVSIVVTNPDTQTGTLSNGYIFVAAPTVTNVSPASGPAAGSTAITVTGTGFVSGATVAVGGVACTGVSFVNSTSITCTTGAHAAGAVSCVVTNPDTQTGTLGSAYTYVAAPTVTSITASSGPRRASSGRAIVGTGFVSGCTVAIGGVACTSVTFNSSTSLTVTTGAFSSDGAKNVVVTNPDTQTGTLTSGYTVAWDPLDAATTCVLWLDADDSSTITLNGSDVSQWGDKSGSGNHFTQSTAANQPTPSAAAINGRTAIRFTAASSKYLSGPTFAALTAGHSFGVFKAISDPGASTLLSGLEKFGTSASSDQYPWTDGAIYCGFGSTVRQNCTNPTPLLTSARLAEVVTTSAKWHFFLDGGTALFTTATNTVAFTTTPTLGRSAAVNTFMDGYIAERIIYNAELSAGDKALLKTYINNKWGTSAT